MGQTQIILHQHRSHNVRVLGYYFMIEWGMSPKAPFCFVFDESGSLLFLTTDGAFFISRVKIDTSQIVYRVAIYPRGNLPYIQVYPIVLPYNQSTNYLYIIYSSQSKSTLYPDHPYSATLYPVTL